MIFCKEMDYNYLQRDGLQFFVKDDDDDFL